MTTHRVPKGVATGGQFAASARDESAVDLSGQYDDVESLVGPTARREFNAAADHYKPRLHEWATSLSSLSETELGNEAESAIHASALVNSWNGNWEHEHFKASACYFESQRRKSASHASDCPVSTTYDRAFNSVVRSQGHGSMARPLQACSCGGPTASEEDD